MNEGEMSTHDVLRRLKVERPDCSYVVNSMFTMNSNTNGEQKSEEIKRILRQCPEDDRMVCPVYFCTAFTHSLQHNLTRQI